MSNLPADPTSLPPARDYADARPAAPTGALAARQFELATVVGPSRAMRRRARWPWVLTGALAGLGGGWLLLDRIAPARFDGRALLEWNADAPTIEPAVVARIVSAEAVVARALDRIDSGVMTSDAPKTPRALDARREFAEHLDAQPTGGDRSVTVHVVAGDAYRARGQAQAVAQSLAEHLASRAPASTTRPIDVQLIEIESRIGALRTEQAQIVAPSDPSKPPRLQRDDLDTIDADLIDVDARHRKFADALADAELAQSRQQASLVEHVQLLRRSLDELDRAMDEQSNGATTAPTDQSTTLEGEYLAALRTYLAQVEAGRTEEHPEVVRAKDRMARVDQLRGGAPTRADTPLGRSRALVEDGAKLRAGLAASEGHLASLRAVLDTLATTRTQLRAERAAAVKRRAIGEQIDTLRRDATALEKAREDQLRKPPAFRITPLDATPAHRDPVRTGTILGASTLAGSVAGLLASTLAGIRLPRRKSKLVGTLPDDKLSAIFGGAPVVAHVPRATGPWDQVNPLAAGQTVEALSAVRAHVLQLRERGIATARVIAVVAPMPGAGTTGIVTGLGTLMARSQRLTACVDCNLLSPNLHEKLGLQLSPGWLDAVAGRSALRPTLQPTGDSHLFGFALGTVGDDAGHDLIASQRRQQFVSQLATRFDTVLLDLPPMACGASSLVQLRGTDGALLVLTGQEDPQTLTLAAEDLRKAGARVLGLIVNHR